MINLDKFSEYANLTSDWIESYIRDIESYSVRSNVTSQEISNKIPRMPPGNSQEFPEILKDFKDIIIPGITHWQHPNFHAYFPSNNSLESILAEFLTSALGVNCMMWETSPSATELEEKVIDWLKVSIGLDSKFKGVICESASVASLTAIICARELKTNFGSNGAGTPNNLRVYTSEQAHSSIDKAVKISGIGLTNLIKVPVNNNLEIIPEELEKLICQDIRNGFIPTCVVGTIGTTNTLANDPIYELSKICKRHKIWFHVDAAYSGSALLLPEFRRIIKGLSHFDSFLFNPHKWLFTNFDCTSFFVKNVEVLKSAFEISSPYLNTSENEGVVNYKDWGISLGRRFRALKLWIVIKSFGIDGLKEKLRYHIKLAQYFGDMMKTNSNFVIVYKNDLNLICFYLQPKENTDINAENNINIKLVEEINNTGELFLSYTNIRSRTIIRLVIGQTYVKKYHVDKAWNIIEKVGNKYCETVLRTHSHSMSESF